MSSKLGKSFFISFLTIYLLCGCSQTTKPGEVEKGKSTAPIENKLKDKKSPQPFIYTDAYDSLYRSLPYYEDHTQQISETTYRIDSLLHISLLLIKKSNLYNQQLKDSLTKEVKCYELLYKDFLKTSRLLFYLPNNSGSLHGKISGLYYLHRLKQEEEYIKAFLSSLKSGAF